MHIYTFLAKITKRSLKMTLRQSISINFAFECIRNIEHSYILKNSTFSLASTGASLYRREAGERKKESTRGTMGREKRKSEVFPSSHRPPHTYYFSVIAIFIRIPSGSLYGKDNFTLSCKPVILFLRRSSDAELFMSRTLFELRPTQTKTTTILFFVGTRS